MVTGNDRASRPPQFLRRVRNRPSLRRRSRLHAMIRAIGVAGGVAVVAFGVRFGLDWALTTEALALRRVVLHQVPAMLIEPVRAQLTPRYGQNLLALDLAELRSAVETLPAVRQASIRRVLPDGLVVSVEPRRPRALLSTAAGTWVVDSDGVVLESGDGDAALARVVVADRPDLTLAPGDLVSSIPGVGPRLAAALAVVERLDEGAGLLVRPIDHVRIDGEGVVLVLASPALEVVVGDDRDLERKLAAVRLLLRADPPGGPATIDARYQDMLVVRDLVSGSD